MRCGLPTLVTRPAPKLAIRGSDFETPPQFVDPLLDAQAPELTETTTHIAVYKTALSGERSLVRHFLRTSDGAVVEVLGDLSKTFLAERPGIDALLKTAANASGLGNPTRGASGDGKGDLCAVHNNKCSQISSTMNFHIARIKAVQHTHVDLI